MLWKKDFAKMIVYSFLLCFFYSSTALAADIPIVFRLNEKLNPDDVYVTFYNCHENDDNTGTISTVTGTYNGPAGTGFNLSTTKSYSMSSITGNASLASGVPAGVPAVLINQFKSGRIFISYDSGMQTFGCTEPSTEPSSNDPNLGIRFQPVELDVRQGSSSDGTNTPVINTDLTYIDYAAIALSLKVQQASGTIANNPLLTTVTSKTLTDLLGKSTETNYTTVRPSSSDRLPSSKFTRVLSPTSADMNSKFHDWSYYLKTYLHNSTVTQGNPVIIKGIFAGVGTQPAPNNASTKAPTRNQTQTYNYEVTFNNSGDALMTAQAGSGDGQAAGIAGSRQGNGVGLKDIKILYTDLNGGTGIYGNNPKYTIVQDNEETDGIENDFYGWVVGDLLAGLSWGFPGSPVKFNATYAKNLVIGDMDSVKWYGGIDEDGTTYSTSLSPAGVGTSFGKAQNDISSNYHTYATALKNISASYGFGLQDRNGATLIQFNRIDHPKAYLEVCVDTEGQSAVQASPTQDTGVTLTVHDFTPKELTEIEIQNKYSVYDFDIRTSMCSFNASISPKGGYGTFMIDTDAITDQFINPGLKLMKFFSNGTSLAYKAYSNSAPDFSDGAWWITDSNENILKIGDTVTDGEHYNVNFVIKDNGDYDEDRKLGAISDPVALGSQGSGGSTGCVLNPEAGLSATLPALLAIGLIGLTLRRKPFRKE